MNLNIQLGIPAVVTLIGAVAMLYPKGGARPVTQQVAALHIAAGN